MDVASSVLIVNIFTMLGVVEERKYLATFPIALVIVFYIKIWE